MICFSAAGYTVKGWLGTSDEGPAPPSAPSNSRHLRTAVGARVKPCQDGAFLAKQGLVARHDGASIEA